MTNMFLIASKMKSLVKDVYAAMQAEGGQMVKPTSFSCQTSTKTREGNAAVMRT